MQGFVYLNGQLVPADQARVSIYDHGLLYGHGLFETMRAYGGRVFRLEEHVGRLVRSAEAIGIPMGGQWSALEQSVYSVLQANTLLDARIRMTVTAGIGPGIPVLPAPGPPGVFVVASAMPPGSPELFERGLHTAVWSHTRSSFSAIATMKSTNYLENLLARSDARQRGADDAIILNDKRFIVETSLANVFFVRAGHVLTPTAEGGLLRGITREIVMQLAADQRFELEQRWISLQDTVECSEAFATNSVIEVMPIVSIDGRPVGEGRPGPVTRTLAKAYRDLVIHELGLRQAI